MTPLFAVYWLVVLYHQVLITNSIESEDNISPDFTLASKYISVLNGYKLHYIDDGLCDGIPIVFLHGNPTSVYLWRNVMPYLENKGRIIGVDLIGMGKSDKLSSTDPEYEYNFVTHFKFIETFINKKLRLKNIILVLHDWGSAIGFYYAYKYKHNVKGIVFMEAMSPPLFPVQDESQAHELITLLRSEVGEELVVNQNALIEQFLPIGIARNLTEEEMDVYREPFILSDDRYVLLRFPEQVPIEGEPEDVWQIVSDYAEWFEKSNIPKLQIYVDPGAITTVESVEYNQDNLKNYESLYVGYGIHFIQEDHPQKIGRGIADWVRKNFLGKDTGKARKK